MAEFELIPGNAIENLPEDPAQAFLQLLETLNSNFDKIYRETDPDAEDLRLEYVNIIREVCAELGIDFEPAQNAYSKAYFPIFLGHIRALKTRLRIRLRKNLNPSEVRLDTGAKQKIRSKIEEVRELIGESYFDEAKKDRLFKFLKDLDRELDKDRANIRKILTSVAMVTGILGGGTATIANGPRIAQLMSDILTSVGEEAHEEDIQPARLAPPPKLLPAPNPRPAKESD